MSDKKITVTSPLLPNLEELNELLKQVEALEVKIKNNK